MTLIATWEKLIGVVLLNNNIKATFILREFVLLVLVCMVQHRDNSKL